MRPNKRISQNNLDTPIVNEAEQGASEKARKQAWGNALIVLRLLGVFILAGFIAGFLFTYPGFNVQNTSVRGVRYSQASFAENAVKRYRDKNLFYVFFTRHRGMGRILRQNEVLSVRTTVKFPDSVTLRVTERKPFVLIKYDKNEYLADQKGFVFHRLRIRDRIGRLPV
ncbi:MAG: hypothetical protein IJT95_01990, partial [Abditibacteriota bacterium]|nr:hypothetical protein [Abditibacteriota bacterium]